MTKETIYFSVPSPVKDHLTMEAPQWSAISAGKQYKMSGLVTTLASMHTTTVTSIAATNALKAKTTKRPMWTTSITTPSNR